MEKRDEKGIVVEGRNVEEALQAACDMLDTTPNQVDYEVFEGPRGGVLSFLKGRTLRVRVWAKTADERMLDQLLAGLFERMGFDVRYKITRSDDAYEVELETDGSDGLLIGRAGETLTSLQHLISRMASHRDESIRVRVDVAGYRKRRHEQLRRKAQDVAARAHESGREILTEALPADERRIVHLALAEDARVQTRAIGEGTVKRIAIVPQTRTRAAGGRPARPRSGGRPAPEAGDSGAEERGAPAGGDTGRPRGARGPDRGTRSPGRGRGSRGGRRTWPRADSERMTPRSALDECAAGGNEIEADAARATRRTSARGGDGEEVPMPAAAAPETPRERRVETAPADRAPRDAGESAPPTRDESAREPEPEGSYFRIPGGESEAREGGNGAPLGADDDGGTEKAITYGRRPQPGRRRRR